METVWQRRRGEREEESANAGTDGGGISVSSVEGGSVKLQTFLTKPDFEWKLTNLTHSIPGKDDRGR